MPAKMTVRVAALAAIPALLSALLVGCGSQDGKDGDGTDVSASQVSRPSTAEVTSASEVTSTSVAATSTASTSVTTSVSESDTESESAAETTSGEPSATVTRGKGESTAASASARVSGTAGSLELNKDVEPAYEIFAALAGEELFARFSSCDPTGIEDSFNCSGPEVGQFQFFKSEAKAAQTTQVLTELRSSRVVEDTGDRVVGWSTLGTTAVLTVVDNKEGLVMQQMISTDQEDPEKKLRELGLVEG